MYLSKESILQAYELLSKATPSILNNFSAIQYFVATDRYYKNNNTPCDSSDSVNKSKFYEYVKDVVSLDDNHYLSTFKVVYEGNKSVSSTVSSNFFSGSSVEHSNNTPERKFDYPKKGPLLYAMDGKVYKEESYYPNLSEYLPTKEEKFALAVWLLRKEESFHRLSLDEFRLALSQEYSSLLVNLLIPQTEQDIDLPYLSCSDTMAVIAKNDIKGNKPNPNISKSMSTYSGYLSAIKTKPFLILGGFSGTGKSQKVKELAFLTCPNDDEMRKKLGNTENTPGNYCLVSVRPNWHDSTDLLGYYSSINDKYIVTDFVRFLVKAMQYPEIPFFVCLDEMNLAPVEEYFAEYLSVLESRKKVGKEIKTDPLVSCDWFKKDYKGFNIFDELGLLRVGRTQSTGENRQASMFGDTDDDAFDRLDIVAKLKKYGLCLPPNVVVIGTVNMDDTTNSFSRKVIDRAMTFETMVEEFDIKYYEAEDTMTYGGSNSGDWTWILPDEVRANEAIENMKDLLSDTQKTEVTNFINEVNTCLKGSPFQIAYRILNETILYYRATKIVNNGEADLNKVFDDILMQKVLPRIEGDYDKTYKPLIALRTKSETRGWTKSKEKIDFMLGRFSKDDQGGFTSFWN